MFSPTRFLFGLLPVIILFVSACRTSSVTISQSSLVKDLMAAQPDDFSELMAKKDNFRIQVIYTQIDRDSKQRPRFTDHYFNVDTSIYFYPASTVKMPIAFLALEQLEKLRKQGIPVSRNSTMITEKAAPAQTAVYNDPTTPDGRPTVAHYAKKIFVVSDNDASNRLYEMLGQENIHQQLAAKGYKGAQILHRLSLPLSDADNRHTNPISFFDTSGNMLYRQPAQISKLQYIARKDSVGKGYMSRGALVNTPMDFSTKNRIFLADLHNMLRSFIFPEAVQASRRFDVSPEDRRFALQMLSQLPRETVYPDYNDPEHYDGYVKFLMFGNQKQAPIPSHIRIFNKVGWAYGFLTDVAYVVDFKNNIEFMLSATIYCNKDEVLNDDRYEFETVGLPFLGKLGQAIYEMELKRTRKNKPDLSAFQLSYDR